MKQSVDSIPTGLLIWAMSLPNEPSQGPPSGGVRRDLSGAHGPLLSPSAHPLVIEPLRGWHMPLMQDPAFLDLQPLLQRALLLQGPEQLLHALAARRPLAAQVLVAYRDSQKPLALVVSQRLNRSGSCFELLHLRSAEACLAAPELGGAAVGLALVREAFPRARSAASWITSCSSLDLQRQGLLRQLGFQPLRQEVLWRWQPPQAKPAPRGMGIDLQVRQLNRRTGALLWHLEQASCPAQLRQLLDRRCEDLLDQSKTPSLLLVDTNRQTAVAAVRRLRRCSAALPEVELTLHPGWKHLVGPPLEQLLLAATAGSGACLIRSDLLASELNGWLHQLGLERLGEEVLLGRSVWRRQIPQATDAMARRLEAVVAQWQPRRRPLPTPLGR